MAAASECDEYRNFTAVGWPVSLCARMHRYLAATDWAWNTRRMSDGDRVLDLIRGADGKRLARQYTPVDNAHRPAPQLRRGADAGDGS